MNQIQAWQKQNPVLAKRCKGASQKTNRLLTQMLENIVDDLEEIEVNEFDSDFQVNEFLDKYGQRFQQLNALVQALGQVSQ